MSDRIKQMAIEAGLIFPDSTPGKMVTEYQDSAEEIIRFARLVAEECAKACEAVDMFNYDDPGSTYASAIRARFGIT